MNESSGITIKKVIINSLVFAGLLVLTFYIVFKNISLTEMKQAISSVNPGYIAAGMVAMGVFAMGEGLNIGRTLNMFGDGVPVLQSLKYAVIGFFFSSVTPSASGGQPMQIYYMHHDGIKVSHGALSLLFELLSFETICVTYAVIGYFTQLDILTNSLGNGRFLFLIGIVINALIAIFIVMAIFSKHAVSVVCRGVVKFVGLFSRKKAAIVDEKSHLMVQEYRSSAVYFKKNRMIFVKTLFTTAVQMLAMFSIPFLVYMGLGLTEYSAFQVISLQAVLFEAVSFLPLPGAVGASEGAFIVLFRVLFPPKLLGGAMVLSRCLSFYICVIISGVAVCFFTRKILNKKKVK